VQAAKKAFPGWAGTTTEERAKYLQRITEGLQARMGDIAQLITQEVGMPIHLSPTFQAGLPAVTFGSMSQLLDTILVEEQIGNSLVVREPVGVVGPSRHGTTPYTRSRPRSRPPWRPAAPSCSNRRSWPR
jgi:aldehyde dehydrogenase (NAD+)